MRITHTTQQAQEGPVSKCEKPHRQSKNNHTRAGIPKPIKHITNKNKDIE
jgi:hypothetical protein